MRATRLLIPLLLTGCSDYAYHQWEQADVFFQDAADQNDILMVIDDSASMEPYQSALAARFDEFLSWFDSAEIDYHIGALTTDIHTENAGQVLGEVITPETSNPSQVFADIVQVGTDGNGTEMGFESTRMALVEPAGVAANQGFLRDSAYLSIIFVSDEQDSSPDPIPDYVRELQNTKGNRRDFVRIGAILSLDQLECQDDYGSQVGTRYMLASEMTEGLTIDICAEGDDFANDIVEMSLNISRLQEVFYLTETASPNSLLVEINEEDVPCDAGVWTYENRNYNGNETGAIVFSQSTMPSLGDKISVRYNFGSGSLDGFCED